MLPAARRCARGFAGEGIDEDDAIAEAFARAFVRWRDVSAKPHRDAWLLRVLINQLVDQSRRARLPLPSSRGRPYDEADAVSSRVTLAHALRRLPRRQREVLALRYVADLTEAQVSDVLGISSNTVKRHLSRAASGMRSILGPNWEVAEDDR
jgi:RNA polymerase sigma-70 factor, ECF subfamily